MIFATLLVAFAYPVSGGWKWGTGWLDAMGFYDFAGSSIVHAFGGFGALALALHSDSEVRDAGVHEEVVLHVQDGFDLFAHFLLGDSHADKVLAVREVVNEGHEELGPVLGLAL